MTSTSPSFARCLRFAVALAAAVALAGCNLVGFGYSQGETIAAWKADEYFSLEAEQKDLFRARFARFYNWHRYQQLPEYVTFLTRGKQRLEDGLDRADIEWFTDGLQARYARIVERGAPDAAEVLATLTAQQLAALQKQWAKDNRKFQREHKVTGTLEERKQERVKRTVTQVKDWVGSLSSEQEQRIAQLSNDMPDTDRLRYEDRLRRQREFLKIMEARSDAKSVAPQLRDWLVNWRKGRNPEYEKLSDLSWEKRVRLYIEVERMLTPQQRQHAMQKVQGYIDDFRKLSDNGARVADSR
jgi:hypothetical protein